MSDEPVVGMLEGVRMETSMSNPVDYAGPVNRFYANQALVNVSLFEIRLVANFILGISPENNHLIASETLLLSMSPELAESVYRLLEKALTAYRRDYGELRSARKSNPSVQEHVDPTASNLMDKA